MFPAMSRQSPDRRSDLYATALVVLQPFRQMKRAPPSMRDFAGQLLAAETNADAGGVNPEPAIFRVCEKLQTTLAAWMGRAGFQSLLWRALAVSTSDVPWLKDVRATPDGCLEGLKKVSAGVQPDEIARAGVVVIAELIALMATFVGEELAFDLVREAWPQLSPENVPVLEKN